MSRTKDLLLKIRMEVLAGRMPAERVPLEDVKQCVYAELQVNCSTFTEQRYAEISDQFERLCANVMEGETDQSKLILLIDALVLCTDMISREIYSLANGEYWRYKHSRELDNPEVVKIIDWIDRERKIEVFNYDFVKEYCTLPVKIFLDAVSGMRYVLYKGRKMFFPREWDDEKITEYYRSVEMEQDSRSPHCYDHGTCGVRKGDVVVDVGAAEGIFALDCVERVERLYLIESDSKWIEALEQTFYEDRDKVQIIHGFLDSYHDGDHVSIDVLFEGQEINYIKMDIEGAEKAALAGASEILENRKNIRCAICSYHCRGDEQSIRSILESHGFIVETSKGYMCPNWTMEAYLEAELRRGVVFGRKE